MATATRATISSLVICPRWSHQWNWGNTPNSKVFSHLLYIRTFHSKPRKSLSTPMENVMLLTREAAFKLVIMNKSLCFELIPASAMKRKQLTTLSNSTIVLSQLLSIYYPLLDIKICSCPAQVTCTSPIISRLNRISFSWSTTIFSILENIELKQKQVDH